MASTMEEKSSNSSDSGNRRQPSRLQRRPPAINIVPVSPIENSWNEAIPLLSPLVSSPTFPVDQPSNLTMDETKVAVAVAEKTPVFKKWQHPAAPFCYEQSTFVPSFVPV